MDTEGFLFLFHSLLPSVLLMANNGMQVSLFASVSVRSCRGLAHSECDCKTTFCHLTTVIFTTQNGSVVSGFLSTSRLVT